MWGEERGGGLLDGQSGKMCEMWRLCLGEIERGELGGEGRDWGGV